LLSIHAAQPQDEDAIWAIFHEIVSIGETYAFDPNTSREEALRLWVEKPTATYVAELDGEIVGTYYIKPNQPALGAHVCNCGYMVALEARGRGIATAMCEHSQGEARRLGFRAMQFNLVVSTNEDALHLWKKLGFQVIGTLPKAFHHKRFGLVDAHVLYKWFD
jgi:RimJ/RimL family protein N-acetyltransferase